MDTVWIDVSMWSGLSGKTQPFTDVKCDPPETDPADAVEWQEWALEHLNALARQDSWQPGRYHFTVQERDPEGRPLSELAHGIWEWRS